MTTYPDVDTDVSGYTAEVRYDSGDGSIKPLALPGRHDAFYAARGRAMKAAQALRSGGEIGCYPWISYSGERPDSFPRNGVKG